MREWTRDLNISLIAVAAVALLAAPFLAYPMFLMKLLCFALLAGLLNLLVGYAGLLSFGHAMFFGSAGYVAAYAAKVWGWDLSLAISAGAGVAAVLGALTGLLAIRRRDIHFSMRTLAFSQVVLFAVSRLPFTGGEDGLQDIPRRPLFGLIDISSNVSMYYFVLAVAAGAFWLIYRIMPSPFGQTLKAIRANESRAVSLGYRVKHYKLIGFILSAALAGLAGATKDFVFGLATLSDVDWVTSADAVLMAVVGGLQTMLGPIVGALVIVTMENSLASSAEWILIAQGLIFVLIVMLCRKEIVGTCQALIDAHTLRTSPERVV